MKRKPFANNRPILKAACRVSAAALMLGVSHATSIGLHFQVDYCSSAAYSGYPVTIPAFGIAPSGWQNLTPMITGYGCGSSPTTSTLSETIDTTTSTDGLNPLPSGSLSVTWSANNANFSPFYGYAGSPPTYAGGGPLKNPTTGEQQVYASFLRDGVNFGIGADGADNNQPSYLVDITGLKSVFTNSFVVELIASSDSMDTLTNAFIIDATLSTTQSVTYPSTPTPGNAGGAPWLRGNGGGLSTGSGAFNTDHLQITSNRAAHGTDATANGYDMAGNISGFVITDKPLVTMQAHPVVAGPGDTITLNPYAIGVPPLSYQWRLNGSPISGATNLNLTVTNLGRADAGNYDLVVTNVYGSTTSIVSSLGDLLTLTPNNNIVVDTSTAGAEHDGLNNGATWHASVSDGVRTRTGVMTFNATNTNGIVVPSSASLKSDVGSISFWMKSPTTIGGSGNGGAALFDCASGAEHNGLGAGIVILQSDAGYVQFQATDSNGNQQNATGAGDITDGLWHHFAFTYDDSAGGSVNLYFDGNLIVPNGNNGAWSLPSTEELEIGFSHDTNWNAFNGSLDDVRIYSRMLTQSEVASVYSTGAIVDPTTLQLELNFDAAPVDGFSVGWQDGTDVLQSAPAVTGPYTDLPSVGSPYVVSAKGTQKYFRYRHTPKTVTTNPYLM